MTQLSDGVAVDLTVPDAPAGPPPAAGTGLAAVVARVADQRSRFEDLRHVPRDVVADFKAAGIYRAATPRRFGGDALAPAEFLRMVEAISVADGSAGWVASFGQATTYLAALPLSTQAEIYADGPDLAFSAGIFPVQPAEVVPDGYLVRGRWSFASGCVGADLLGVGISSSVQGIAGKPMVAVLPPSRVEIVDNWDVVGMRGTGSHDLRVDGVVVDPDWTFVRGGAPTVDEPLYRYPAVPYAAQVLAVVGLGVARAALDHAAGHGGQRRSLTAGSKAAERPTYRISLARAEADLRSARAWFFEAAESVYDTVLRGDDVSREENSVLRLSAAHAARVAFSVTQAAYTLGGIGAIQSAGPMQRLLRDASVVPQHAFLSESVYDGAGSVFLGAEPFPGYV
ncbi:flavin-dependent monooxygenase [Kineococcus sp. R8]|uniref:acyl-CoA dehydrogenase family protein n=1 Tax=Kineococcus siccus TaxID=2696567 RepID=UPI00141236E2|nr:acyl-CoA dehydrogenase family protein [Kineococcus siccus]NAZ80400.1 flavin-dependent monooxygenase [Kineococcus siccus]